MIPNNSLQIESIPLHNLEHFDLLARQVVEGFIIGLHKSPFHGFSVEFAEHRLYNPGEPTKNIDWKVYARTDKMFVKRFEEETNLRCQIVMDTSSSMFYPEKKGENKWNKIEFSALAAASLMHLLKKQRDAFGLTLFDKDMYLNTQCKSSTTHHKMLLNYLQTSLDQRQAQKTTSAAQTLHKVADSIHRRSMVVIFSDMFENTDKIDEIFSAIQHLKHNKHEVILFQVMDKDSEVTFEFENRPHLFIDLESGEEVRLQTNQVKDMYQKQMAEFKSLIRLKCLQYKVDYVEVDIKSGFNKVLQSYLVKRARMRT
jgi:uncharacterized protein (DUF58 family)